MADPIRLSDLITPAGLRLLTATGNDLIRRIGFDAARGVIYNVMTGRNLRDSTELLTRRRLVTLNMATVDMFIRGVATIDHFVERLPYLATTILQQGRTSKEERWLAQWILGLNDKASQNILRGDRQAIEGYRDAYIKACDDVIGLQSREWGVLGGQTESCLKN